MAASDLWRSLAGAAGGRLALDRAGLSLAVGGLLGLIVILFGGLSVPLVAGMILAVLILLHVELGLYLFLIVTELVVIPVASPAFMILMVSWVPFLLLRRIELPAFPQNRLMIGILLWMVLTTGILDPLHAGFKQLVTQDMSKVFVPVGLYFVILTVIRTRVHFRRFLGVLAAIGAGLAVIGLAQMFFQIPFFGSIIVDPGSVIRAGGSTGDPVAYGTQTMFLLGLCFAMHAGEPPGPRKAGLLLALVLLAAALIASLNRSAILGVLTFTAVMMVFHRRTGFLVLALVAGAFAIISQTLLFDSLKAQMLSIWVSLTGAQIAIPQLSQDTFTPRLETLQAGLSVFQESARHMLLGAGINGFSPLVQPYLTSQIAIQCSGNANSFIVFLVEMGIPGAAMMVGLIILTLRDLFRLQRTFHRAGDSPMAFLCQGLLAVFVGFLVVSLANTVWFTKFYWILMVMPCLIERLWFRPVPGDDTGEAARAVAG